MRQLPPLQCRPEVRPQSAGIKSKQALNWAEDSRGRARRLQPAAEPPNGFGQQLREIRRRWVGKQLVLAVSVGCTEAAVCFWEGSRRLPTMETFKRLEHFLTRTGVPPGVLSQLKAAHREAVLRRFEFSAASRHCAPDSQGPARRGRAVPKFRY